jgi:hypothetical protein
MDSTVDDSSSSSTWGGRTVETASVAAELRRLDEEVEQEFGSSVELDGSSRASSNANAAARAGAGAPTLADPGPYRGNVESRTIQADNELRAVIAKLAESKQALQQLQVAAAAAQDKSRAAYEELDHVVGVITQVGGLKWGIEGVISHSGQPRCC